MRFEITISPAGHLDTTSTGQEDNVPTNQQTNNKTSQQDVYNFSRGQKVKNYHDDHPTTAALKKLADNLMKILAQKNNDPNFISDAKADTIAVGLNNNGDIIVTGNLKERRKTESTDKSQYVKLDTPEGKQKARFQEYGITKEISEIILSLIRNDPVFKKSRLNVKVVEEKVNPKDNVHLTTMMAKAKDHASKHAESKMNAHCKHENEKLKKVGVSKEPCQRCHEELAIDRVSMEPSTPGNKRVTNRREVGQDEVEVVNRIDRSKQSEADLHLYNNNIHLSPKAAKETIINDAKRSFRPGASVGLITGVAQLANIAENKAYEPFAEGGTMNADAGSVKNILGGETYYANASVLQGRAGFGDVASVGASALSAGAHAEYGWNNSVGANLSVARVDANLGPIQVGAGLNFDTHADVGVNGVSASILGIGFSVGPRFGIQTPFFDFMITLF